MKIKNVISLTLGGVLLISAATSSAFIRTSQNSETEIVVSFTESELRTADGRAEIESRIRSAAKAVCGDSYQKTSSLKAMQQQRQCIRDSLAEAMQELDGSTLFVTVR